jgi:hypothetical protein
MKELRGVIGENESAIQVNYINCGLFAVANAIAIGFDQQLLNNPNAA